ncbi:hypothetical protein HHK36_015776 [Tetracentron sinense]|uniref:cyclin-dependent kinase n=1 Tax=Tetracentron sinense TaxID=13715 RepID=A0A834Z9W7_TETSI|nr:hypothetical protein HHK36_015776 [Tetracentron sinense]
MASGRHGGYRDKEFRDRESDIGVSRRRDLYYSNEEYDSYRNGDSNRERSRGRELVVRERIKVRQKDIKEREVINGEYHSSSSTNNSGSNSSSGRRRGGLSARTADREPGELSSGSGSDDGIVSESQLKENEFSELENGLGYPPGKKRKFSPIVWDREEKELNNSSKERTVSASTPLPPPPPLPSSLRQSPNLAPQGGLQNSPIKPNRIQVSQPSPVRPSLAPGPVGSDVSESPTVLSSSSPQEKLWSNDQEPGQLEEEDFVPARNISASRWADESNSPRGEAVSDDKEMLKRRKKTPPSESLEIRLNANMLSHEPGELRREGFEVAGVNSSGSEEVSRGTGPTSRDESPVNNLEESDFMEIDEEHENSGASVKQLDTDSEDESDCGMTPEPIGPPQRSINMLQGCRSVDEFERLNKIDEGTYGVVYRARDKKTGEIVALKKVKMEKEREGFPLTSLREINILLSFHHPSIVDVKEVVVGSNLDSIFMVMEYMEHDLKGLMETMKQPFSQSEVKCLMLQLLEGAKYLHDNWVLHRDMKTSNLLLNNRGELKICDFGLSRQYGSPLKPYTHLVVTLWYRAPELLLGAKQYSTAIDMWSLGCIMAELLAKEPLFCGKTEFDQLDKIFRTLGTPSEKIWPGFSKLPGVKVNFVKHQFVWFWYNLLRKKFPATSFTGSPVLSDSGFDLLNKLLTYDPEKRITAEDALNHEWFREVPLPKSKDFMPTFPAQHAQDRRSRRIMKSPDPLEELRRKELQQGELGTGGLFG